MQHLRPHVSFVYDSSQTGAFFPQSLRAGFSGEVVPLKNGKNGPMVHSNSKYFGPKNVESLLKGLSMRTSYACTSGILVGYS